MLGGAAGGGKSSGVLSAGLQYVDVPGYSALILRQSFTDLSQPGALLDRARLWLGPTDARSVNGGKQWVFPSGATLTFGHVSSYKEATEQYSSAEFQFIGIDELTQGWDERTYKFLFSRIRRPSTTCRLCSRPLGWADDDDGTGYRHTVDTWCTDPTPPNMKAAPDGTTLADVPLRMRSATNPGGVGHQWVKERFVDPETRAEGAVFVPAKLTDNPHVDQVEYRKMLEMQDPVLAARLLHGDWAVVDEGLMFQRGWFLTISKEDLPPGIEWARYWDLASQEKKKGESKEPDATAGCLLGIDRKRGNWFIADIQHLHMRPKGVEDRIVQCAEDDQAWGHVPVWIEQEPGSSGVYVSENFTTLLAGYEYHPERPQTKKQERARPASSAAEAGRVVLVGHRSAAGSMVQPPWAKAFLDEIEIFPYPGAGSHDDQVDSFSGAMKVLTKPRKRRARYSSAARRDFP